MQPYVKSLQIFACPSNPNSQKAGINYSGSVPPEIRVGYHINKDRDATQPTIPERWMYAPIADLGVAGHMLADFEDTAQTITMFDSAMANISYALTMIPGTAAEYQAEAPGNGTNTAANGWEQQPMIYAGHLGTANFLFADGHVKWRKQNTIKASEFGLTSTAVGVSSGSSTAAF